MNNFKFFTGTKESFSALFSNYILYRVYLHWFSLFVIFVIPVFVLLVIQGSELAAGSVDRRAKMKNQVSIHSTQCLANRF